MTQNPRTPPAHPLRVVFVIQKLGGLSGGAERVFVTTARAMAARGLDVRIAIYETGGEPPAYDTGALPIENLFPFPRKVTAHRGARSSEPPNSTSGFIRGFPHRGPFGPIKWELTHGLFARRLTASLRRRPADVVIGFLPPAITAATRAGQATGTPVIASLHNVPAQDYATTSRWDQNPVSRARARAALSEADAITVLLDAFKPWFTPAEQERLIVLPNAVGRVAPQSEPPALRSKVVLAVGRLTPIKQYDLLVEAWAQLHASYPDWQVHIYGIGSERPALEALIAAHGLTGTVLLQGVRADIGRAYDDAAFLCHPSAFEGFGMAVAEAMAHGLPAVGFAECPGVNTLISDGRNGLLVPVDTDPVTGLARCMTCLLEDPHRRSRFGREAIHISEIYAANVIHDRWERLIHQTAAHALVTA